MTTTIRACVVMIPVPKSHLMDGYDTKRLK